MGEMLPPSARRVGGARSMLRRTPVGASVSGGGTSDLTLLVGILGGWSDPHPSKRDGRGTPCAAAHNFVNRIEARPHGSWVTSAFSCGRGTMAACPPHGMIPCGGPGPGRRRPGPFGRPRLPVGPAVRPLRGRAEWGRIPRNPPGRLRCAPQVIKIPPLSVRLDGSASA